MVSLKWHSHFQRDLVAKKVAAGVRRRVPGWGTACAASAELLSTQSARCSKLCRQAVGSVILLIEEPGHGNEPLRAPVVEPQEHTVPAQTCLRQHQPRHKQCHVPPAP